MTEGTEPLTEYATEHDVDYCTCVASSLPYEATGGNHESDCALMWPPSREETP